MEWYLNSLAFKFMTTSWWYNSSSLALAVSLIALSAAFVIHVTRVQVCALDTQYFTQLCLQIWQILSGNICIGDRAKTTNTTDKSIPDSSWYRTDWIENKQTRHNKTNCFVLMSQIYSFKYKSLNDYSYCLSLAQNTWLT